MEELFIPGLGALGAGGAGLAPLVFLRLAGVDEPLLAVRESVGPSAPPVGGLVGGRSPSSAGIARAGSKGSFRSLATSFNRSGKISPLFLKKNAHHGGGCCNGCLFVCVSVCHDLRLNVSSHHTCIMNVWEFT